MNGNRSIRRNDIDGLGTEILSADQRERAHPRPTPVDDIL
jgi:hypothetical protein